MEQTRGSRRRSQLFDNRGELAVFIVLALVSLSLIILPDTQQRVIASYVEDLALAPSRSARLWVLHLIDMYDRNRRLGEEVMALRLELDRTTELRRENERLREQLAASRRTGLGLVGCKILADGAGRLGGQTLLLDRGALHGVQRDMPVVAREGLAGRVLEVYPDRARAALLTHRWCAVSVRDTRSRQVGIVEWNPRSPSTLMLRGASYMDDVAAGDTLVTSGLSAIFPDGLMVGLVDNVRPGPSGLLLDVTVRPAVDFTRLEELYVLVDSLRLATPGMISAGADSAPAGRSAASGTGEEEGGGRSVTDAVVELQ
jgi:rod shape-determining protein MreC